MSPGDLPREKRMGLHAVSVVVDRRPLLMLLLLLLLLSVPLLAGRVGSTRLHWVAA